MLVEASCESLPCHEPTAVAAPVLDDDKTIVVPLTKELVALDQPLNAIQQALAQLAACTSELAWFTQYEALLTLRRAIVHHPRQLEHDQVELTIRTALVATESLRSTVAKNALLVLTESFEFLSRPEDVAVVFGAQVVTALLKRSSSEKKFLRDASLHALAQMARFGASPLLVYAACAHADSKNSRVCANAASLVASSLEQMNAKRPLSLLDRRELLAICKSLSVFRRAKDANARNASSQSFAILGRVLGEETMRQLLLATEPPIMDKLDAARVLEEVYGTGSGQSERRRSSLRELMQHQSLHRLE